MNHYIAEYIGAFVRWIFNGFKSSYIDQLRGNKGFKTQKERNSYNNQTAILGYITAFIIIIIIIAYIAN